MSDDTPPPLPDPPPYVPPEPEAPPPPPPVLRYAVASAATGEILRIVRCTADQATAQAQAGECIVQHDDAAPATHYLQDGAEVLAFAYSVAQLADKAQRPHPAATWDNTAMAWADPRTLAQRKADRWAAMHAAREAAEFGGFVWDGSAFDSDSQSQARIMGAAQLATLASLAQQPFAIDWTLADNSVRTLSGADMIAAGQAMGVHVATQHETGRLLRAAIAAAATAAEVDAVVWPPA